MEKDFDTWNEKKKGLHVRTDVGGVFFNEREIWWCRLGVNVGSEQDGSGSSFLRPVVILRSFGPDICVVVPLTTSHRKHPLRIPVGTVLDKKASAILSQMRVVDTRRLVEKVEFLDKGIFSELRKAVRKLF